MKNKIYTIAIIALLLGLTSCTHQHKLVKTVVIDVGHGGKDTGTKVENIAHSESTLLLEIAKAMLIINGLDKDRDLKIVLTRYGDDYLSLRTRIQQINYINPDLAMSLHIGFDKDKTKNGVDAYYSPKNIHNQQSQQMAKKLLDCVAVQKLQKGSVQQPAKLSVIRRVKVPATTMILGYLSNQSDREYLSTQKGRDQLAKQIYHCLKIM